MVAVAGVGVAIFERPASARRDLLRVLLADSHVRADLIRQFYERDDTRNLAE